MLSNREPFVIAEMSGNHNESFDKAMQIVEAAAKTGAHALKIQTYTADTLTIDSDADDFQIRDSKSLWKGSNLYSLYKKAMTPWEWHKPIFERCKQLGIIGFSTPFDETAVDFLEELNVPFYKVASFENSDLPLIRKVARTKKPMIISTGMATLSEIMETVETAKSNGCPRVILLKCTSSYPADPVNSNLNTIPHLRNLTGCEVGLSDHTLGIGAAVASIALGVTVIEKHFILDRSEGGVDSAFSLEPAEMSALVRETKVAYQALGSVVYGPSEEEKASMKFRRSIYVTKDVREGDVLTKDNIRIIRPGYGLHPRFFDLVLGKRAAKNLKRGDRLAWESVLK